LPRNYTYYYKMTRNVITPSYIFESSWEVCNKVGGIYTVLSTRANTLQTKFKDHIIFIGPDLGQDRDNILFIENRKLCAKWRKHATLQDNLAIRVGRWNIPGEPIVILVDFQSYYAQKDQIYKQAWEDFGVDSLHGYGDYDEASMFSYAAGLVVESFFRFNLTKDDKAIYQVHEWMTGLGALYIQKKCPEIGTIFTTHATSIGRSIAGNQKPLYDYLSAYNGDQMARELNIEAKHSIEKVTAHHVDCFTTVSEITGHECEVLLDKKCDKILMNGFEDNFVPSQSTFGPSRKLGRRSILDVVNKLLGEDLDNTTLLVSTSGRYEFQNKGIDVFLEAMSRLNSDPKLQKNVIALVTVPAWVKAPRADLQARLASKVSYNTPLDFPFITHTLHDMDNDRLLNMLRGLNLHNSSTDKVKLVFIPCYLNYRDGILNGPYYEYLIALDLTIYPSYYEPWGYTPLESIAFRVPTITTDLSGFGLWVKTLKKWKGMDEGIAVIHRSDNNYSEVVEETKNEILKFSERTTDEIKSIRKTAAYISKKALWEHFIKYYYEAYDIALKNAEKRIKESIIN